MTMKFTYVYLYTYMTFKAKVVIMHAFESVFVLLVLKLQEP